MAASASDTENAADMGLPAIDTDDRLMTESSAAEDADEPSFGMNALVHPAIEGDTDRVARRDRSPYWAAKTPKRKPSHACGKTLDDTLR